jgi:hypothetical protein
MLIDIKTNLKSLKFGNDRPGGGSSNQPYIQKEIPTDYTNKSPDFLLRNGYLNPVSVGQDVSRLTQMFIDLKSPQGLLFVAKQNLLSRTGVATEASKGIAYGTSPTADYKKAALNEGIYNPLSTLAQAGIVGIGGHLNKQGIDPSGLSPLSINKYDDILKNQDIEDNRLYSLVKTKFPQAKEQTVSPSVEGFLNKFKAKASDIFSNFFNLLPEDENMVLKYNGGPGAPLGIGNTIIKRYTKTGLTNPLSVSDPNHFFGKNTRITNRTENSWKQEDKSPVGASIRYFNITNDENPGRVLPDLTADGGYTYEPNFVVSTTNPDTLELEPTKSPTQAIRPFPTIEKDANNNPKNLLGASNTFKEFTQETIDNNSNFVVSTTKPNTLDLELDKSSAQAIRPFPTVDKNKTLGLSNKYSQIIGSTIDNSNENNSLGTLKTPSVYKDSYENQNGDLLKTNPEKYPNVLTQEQINSIERNETNAIQDFRQLTPNKSLAPDYKTKNIEQRVHIGDPGNKTGMNLLNYKTGGKTLDAINALNAYQGDIDKGKPINDLVKFRISILDNDSTTKNINLHFRAFIKNISDQYTANWGNIQYVGRGENFYNYTGFDRVFNLSFTVMAQSKAELIPMYKKLNILASSLAPDYTQAGFMRGNLIKLTVGGYLYEQVGLLKGLTYTIPDDSTWEIGLDEKGSSDSSVKELPHRIDVSGFTFVPIHNFLPSRITDVTNKPTQRYIALSNGENDNY